MVMLWIAVIMLIDSSPVKLKAIQQPCVNKLFQRSIDRRLADVILVAFAGKNFNQRVRVKMLVTSDYLLDQETTLLSLPQPANLKVFFESLLRRQSDVDAR